MLSKLCATAIVLAASSSCVFGAGVKIGDPGPPWSDLVGVDDKKHGLDEYPKAEAVVLVFTCNTCPVAVAYQDRLIALQKEYSEKGVQVVALNVNKIPGDGFEDMKARARDKEFPYPYLYDPSQKTARHYGARTTPHVFLLDKQRKVAYVGAIDDNMNDKKVKTRYLRDALDAVLKGEKPPKEQTEAFGCSVKYEKEP
jgi:peroxiredoxin